MKIKKDDKGHVWGKRSLYTDSGYKTYYQWFCKICAVGKVTPAPPSEPMGVMGPYKVWDGTSSCRDVILKDSSDRVKASIQNLSEKAENDVFKKNHPEGYYWCREDDVPFLCYLTHEGWSHWIFPGHPYEEDPYIHYNNFTIINGPIG